MGQLQLLLGRASTHNSRLVRPLEVGVHHTVEAQVDHRADNDGAILDQLHAATNAQHVRDWRAG